MTRLAAFLLLALALPFTCSSQVRRVKLPASKIATVNTGPKPILSLGVGVARSVLYLARNVNNKNDARGITSSIAYDHGAFLRFNVEYTLYNAIDIRPTWYHVKAQTLEANINVISKSKDEKLYFYPFAGFSYNVFTGYYTGVNDFLNLRSIYKINTNVRTNWLGVNLGAGADYNLKRGAIYACFKMRFGRTAGFNDINVMDVYLAAGVRVFFALHASDHRGIWIFGGTRSRYLLRKKEVSK